MHVRNKPPVQVPSKQQEQELLQQLGLELQPLPEQVLPLQREYEQLVQERLHVHLQTLVHWLLKRWSTKLHLQLLLLY